MFSKLFQLTLSQNVYFPSDPTVASSPVCLGWKAISLTGYISCGSRLLLLDGPLISFLISIKIFIYEEDPEGVKVKVLRNEVLTCDI